MVVNIIHTYNNYAEFKNTKHNFVCKNNIFHIYIF